MKLIPQVVARAAMLLALGVSAATLSACSDDEGPGASASPVENVESDAADLRTNLNLALGEHQILAAKATGAALGGREAEFQAYGELLNENGTRIGGMVGAAYGDGAKSEFNRIWSAHNGFFVDYTVGVATQDKAKQDKAVADLTGTYVPEFSKLLAGATGLPEDAVAALTTEHVVHTKEVVDAQAAGNWTAAYGSIRKAFEHIQGIGDALAPAIADRMPEKFPGDATGPEVDFRVALNLLLQEHMYAASFATGAALGGREAEFAEAGALLNENGARLGAAIGSLYGDGAKNEFNRIWSAHNGFFVDYTVGVATQDKAKQDKAVADLTGTYVPEFSKLLAGATGLPEDAVAALTTEHVLMTKAVVDAQAAGDAAGAAEKDRASAEHMHMIGDALAAAIVGKLPEKF